MNKEMIISNSHHDTRVAILEDDQVVEIFIEREKSRGVVGNIYKGRVSKVLPGMQSSFVDIGLERDAFLYVTEVVNTVEEFERLESGDEDAEAGGCRHRTAGRSDAAVAGGAGRGRRSHNGRHRWWRPRRAPRPRPRAGARASRREDRTSPQRRTGSSRPGRQRAARDEGRAPDVARDDARTVPGVHADGRSRRRIPQDRIPGRALPLRGSSVLSASSTGSPVASSSAPPPPGVRKKTSSATFRTLRSGVDGDPSANGRASAAGRLLFQEQSLVTKLLLISSRTTTPPSESTTSRSIDVWCPSWSESCRRCCHA